MTGIISSMFLFFAVAPHLLDLDARMDSPGVSARNSQNSPKRKVSSLFGMLLCSLCETFCLYPFLSAILILCFSFIGSSSYT